MRSPEENLLQGDFGEAWIEAVAAGSGLLHGRPSTLGLQKADVAVTYRGLLDGTYCPSVLVQVKTTTDLRKLDDGDYGYDLDVDTYEVLRRDDHATPRILAVIGVSGDGERVRTHRDGTLLVGEGAWVSLEGAAASGNARSKAVRLPGGNTLDEEGLMRMIRMHGVRSSTRVPEYDIWELL